MKVIFSQNSKGNVSPRIGLKLKDLKQINVTKEEPNVECYYNEKLNVIIIRKEEKYEE